MPSDVQQSSACKAFVFAEQTSLNVQTICNPSKQPSYSSHLFKKQWLCLNPTVFQQEHSNNAKTDSVEDLHLDDNDDVCMADFCSPTNHSTASFPDPSNPLAMYKPPDGKLGKALSGSVYQEMYWK
jgi:hypothetical protein